MNATVLLSLILCVVLVARSCALRLNHANTSPSPRLAHNFRRPLVLLSGSTMAETTEKAECEEEDEDGIALDPLVCEDFKILVCSSTSCSRRRKELAMDEFATLGALYERAREASGSAGVNDGGAVEVEESTCLGCCKMAPCVAVEHEDFVGNVGLDGMTEMEMSDRVFHDIVDDYDVDRVWDCVENAIRIMAEESEEEG